MAEIWQACSISWDGKAESRWYLVNLHYRKISSWTAGATTAQVRKEPLFPPEEKMLPSTDVTHGGSVFKIKQKILMLTLQSAAMMMHFCRPTSKLASPWFLRQKPCRIFPLAFGLLQNINSDQQKFTTLMTLKVSVQERNYKHSEAVKVTTDWMSLAL